MSASFGHLSTRPNGSLLTRSRACYLSLLLPALLLLAMVLPANGATEQERIAGLHIVDCLLPGQLRKLGKSTYLSPRRPIKTTASDCNIRGGEYVAYDRADYKSALSVWMASAEAGNAEAQANVGEIFERGLGGTPNYAAALIWYRKSAEQGNKRGQFNLGTLYEQGLGVDKDQLEALNWYRAAWGLPQDSVIFQSAARQQQDTLRRELTEELSSKNAQIKLLSKKMGEMELNNQTIERELKDSRSKLDDSKQKTAELAEQQAELDLMKSLVESLQTATNNVSSKLAKLPRLRAPESTVDATSKKSRTGSATAARIKDLQFGKYYALVIGNQSYDMLNDLDTSHNDAKKIAEVLETRYGFEVDVLLDADRLTIMETINKLHETLGENDNLLVYYAGHGVRISSGDRESGYWLPTNANPPPNDSLWVPNEFITNHLARFNARRILVVADSCYAGLLSSSPGYLFIGERSQQETEEYIRYKLPRRSRLLLSSGGDHPVLDDGGGGHSVFAQVMLEQLMSNDGIMSAPQLYQNMKGEVERRSESAHYAQAPVYKSIKGAGHEVGDFFFVPKKLSASQGIQ